MCIADKIAKYTKYQREKKGISINEFARITGLTPSFISRLESLDYQDIRFAVAEKLAKGLTMSLEDFLRKCKIIDIKNELPPLEYWLKEKYQFTPKAIDDVSLFVEFISKKYKTKIDIEKEIHNKYWK